MKTPKSSATNHSSLFRFRTRPIRRKTAMCVVVSVRSPLGGRLVPAALPIRPCVYLSVSAVI
ncbi:MAG: hypothetical protein ABIE25_00535 [Thermoplasmatota archaeon]